jgi:hypothetical protein
MRSRCNSPYEVCLRRFNTEREGTPNAAPPQGTSHPSSPPRSWPNGSISLSSGLPSKSRRDRLVGLRSIISSQFWPTPSSNRSRRASGMDGSLGYHGRIQGPSFILSAMLHSKTPWRTRALDFSAFPLSGVVAQRGLLNSSVAYCHRTTKTREVRSPSTQKQNEFIREHSIPAPVEIGTRRSAISWEFQAVFGKGHTTRRSCAPRKRPLRMALAWRSRRSAASRCTTGT